MLVIDNQRISVQSKAGSCVWVPQRENLSLVTEDTILLGVWFIFAI